MKVLKLNDIEVTTSHIGSNIYYAAPCNLLLVVRPDNFDIALNELKKEGEGGSYSGVRVIGIDDLSCLRGSQLLYLEILSEKPIDPKQIQYQRNLRGLVISSSLNA